MGGGIGVRSRAATAPRLVAQPQAERMAGGMAGDRVGMNATSVDPPVLLCLLEGV
jgi:hypothetical protein